MLNYKKGDSIRIRYTNFKEIQNIQGKKSDNLNINPKPEKYLTGNFNNMLNYKKGDSNHIRCTHLKAIQNI
jgi:hypothetical protein